MISFVLGFIKALILSTLIIPKLFASVISKSIILDSFKFHRGLITELCSIEDVITWSPFFNMPFISILRDEVILLVKITFSILGKLKNEAMFSLVSKTYLFDSKALVWLERPLFPPILAKKLYIESHTALGLGKEVLALSK